MTDIAAVLIPVPDVAAGRAWYLQAFPGAVMSTVPDMGFEYLAVGSTRIEIVPADEQVSNGAAGSVVYWRVPEFSVSLAHLVSVGAVLYRGPMKIEDDLWMCQVRDPWGNCIGLRGPRAT